MSTRRIDAGKASHEPLRPDLIHPERHETLWSHRIGQSGGGLLVGQRRENGARTL